MIAESDMRGIDSSNLHSTGYDPDNSKLYVRFKQGQKLGGLYRYDDVPSHLFDEFLAVDQRARAAKAEGKPPVISAHDWFKKNIKGPDPEKNPIFKYEKVG